MRIMLLALAFLLVSPLSFAVLLDATLLTYSLGFIVVMVSAMLGITLMLSKSLNSPQLEAWAKSEVREVIVAGILLVVVNVIFFGTSNIVELLTGSADHKELARGFLSDTQGRIEEAYRDSMLLFHHLTMRSGFSVYSSISEFYWAYGTFSAAQYSGASVFFGPMQGAVQGLTNAWFEYAAISILLDFITKATEVLLPVAFIFRFIPFTRQLGNTLLALAIGGAVIFPFSIVLTSQLHGLIDMPNPDVRDDAFNALSDMSRVVDSVNAVCSIQFVRLLLNLNEQLFSYLTCLPVAWIPGAYPVCVGIMMNIVYPIVNVIFRGAYALFFAAEGLLGFFGGNPTGWLTGEELTNIIYPFLLEINNFVLLAYMDALVIAIVSYGGIKSISAALGGEYMMPAISRLVR